MRNALHFLPKPKPKIKPGLYRHYEGQLYLVLWTGKDSKSKEDTVIYQSTEKSKEFGDYSIWTQPLSEFLKEIEINEKMVKQFTALDERETIAFSNEVLLQLKDIIK